MTPFTLHPQLLADCHLLGRLPHSHLLLHRNAAVPWFILVPETALTNLLDLPASQRDTTDLSTPTAAPRPAGDRLTVFRARFSRSPNRPVVSGDMVLHAQGRRWPASVSVQQFAPECMVTQPYARRCNGQALKRKLQHSLFL